MKLTSSESGNKMAFEISSGLPRCFMACALTRALMINYIIKLFMHIFCYDKFMY